MTDIKIGLIRESKVPHDKRVAFSPEQCKAIQEQFPNIQIFVQQSDWRCYTDQEYRNEGINVVDQVVECDVLMGIKEVPKEELIENKTYFFFSHTIKKQAHNKKLLQTVLSKKIRLIDYECLTDLQGNRIIGFGRYAGIVGAYNALMAYGLKYNILDLKPAHLCKDRAEVFDQFSSINLPNIKIVVTGGGRVANGACETMGALKMRKVTPYEFLNYSFREPVYVQLHSKDYHAAMDRSPFNQIEFYESPEKYRCIFADASSYASVCDILIHCAYWNPKAPLLFSKKDMKDPGFRISVISDVTCDINGSIPSTMKASSIEEKFYGYDVASEQLTEAFDKNVISVTAIDNLPCELPRDSSEGFGKHFMERVLPTLVKEDQTKILERATIAQNGKLTERFDYLSDFVA
ncbi:MAG TPA: NAD(P)-dependent oxidoreductase [Bacteroidia bacterium]|nr:NAD(P)-dependent oxidoreductase [Bacteroidia bacterium]HNT80374.1 NAD(P)-dependent oxidoreductase [Bacteroidia bacterium]